MSSSSPHNPSSTPAQFRSKLGTYLTGVAIGFVFLGFVYFFKHQATKREQASAEQTQQVPQESGVDPTGAQP
jgi:uncharacterized membrane protein